MHQDSHDRPQPLTSSAGCCSCRRWNNTVSLTLRALVYDPIVEGCWIHNAEPAEQQPGTKRPRASMLRRLAGTSATFAASGLMHELLLLYALHEGNTYPAGFWFMFFFIQVREGLVFGHACARAGAQHSTAWHTTATYGGQDSSRHDSTGQHRTAQHCMLRHRAALMGRNAGQTAQIKGIQSCVCLRMVHCVALLSCHFCCVCRMQVPLLVAEDVVRRQLRARGIKVPRPFLMGWTTVLVMTSAYFFWYPPVEKYTDVAARVLGAINGGAASLVAGLQGLVQQLGLQDVAQAAAAVSGTVSQAVA